MKSIEKIGIITCSNVANDLDCCAAPCLHDLYNREGRFKDYPGYPYIKLVKGTHEANYTKEACMKFREDVKTAFNTTTKFQCDEKRRKIGKKLKIRRSAWKKPILAGACW